MVKGMAFFDVAGTVIVGNPWRGFLKYPQIPRVRLYMHYPAIFGLLGAKKIGVLKDTQFRQYWIRQMASLLRGMPRDAVDVMFRWIAAEYMREGYREDVVARLQAHKAQGHYVVLISGMFTELTHQFALFLGADVGIGTQLGFDEAGICTGQIIGDGCAGHNKPDFLRAHLAQQALSLEGAETFAYADSYSDVPLLSLANHAVATYPDSELQAVVQARGWETISA